MADEQQAAVVIPTEAPAAAPVVAVAAPTGPEAPAAASVAGTEAAANSAAPSKTEVQKIEAAVVKFTEEVRVALTADEKFFITKVENDYLKAQLEIHKATKVVENTQKQYTQLLEGLVKKYAINPLTHQFNNIELAFTKKA
jgi:hypothetical protein